MVLQNGGVVVDLVVLSLGTESVLVVKVTLYVLPVNLHEVFPPVSLLLMKTSNSMVQFV